jgi:hypothetical protein
MRRIGLSFCAALLILPCASFAQEPQTGQEPLPEQNHHRQTAEPRRETGRRISLGELSPTPEMWFYEQALRQYEDPKFMVRQKAEFKAVQRARRLAALQWYGYSNSRPRTSPDPMYGTASPRWSSNSYDPFRWRGGGLTIFRSADAGYYRMR